MTVSLTILVIVLVLSMSLLFTMKNFAQRQRQFAEPRQNARRAIDYIGGYIRAATDLNFREANPNCLPIWVRDQDGNLVQATYNNVQDQNLAEVGTDILNLGYATSITNIPLGTKPSPIAGAGTVNFNFSQGCPNDALNMQLFKEMTGGCQACPGGGGCCSDLLGVVNDQADGWDYLTIANYTSSNCAAVLAGSGDVIQTTYIAGQTNHVNRPEAANHLQTQCHITGGHAFISFRVQRTDPGDVTTCELQQKRGIFDPTDADTGFFGLLEGIEDLQIAYIYSDGVIWNDSAAHQIATNGNVPRQDGAGGGAATDDVTNVMGVRVSIVSRANTPVPIMERAKFFRPSSEDRAEDLNRDRFYHYRLTSTVMIRNRNLGR